MMIQIDHRESHDVDVFLSDPQLLAFLNPQTRDFIFEVEPVGCSGDGTGFQKFAFEIGEIDFIVGRTLTPNPDVLTDIEGVDTFLETVPEIITKKIFYRGTSIRPRDIFDIAAAALNDPDKIIAALRSYRSKVDAAINCIDRLNPAFVVGAIEQLMIRDKYRAIAGTAPSRALELLRSV